MSPLFSSARRIARLGALVGVLLAPAGANAATYYVAPDGSDGSDGTSETTPWRTLAQVTRAQVRPGDAVLLRGGGVWRETLSPASGTAPAHVVYATYGEGRAVLDGAGAGGYTGLDLSDASYVDVRGLEIRNRAGTDSAVYIRGATHVALDDLYLHDAYNGVLASPSAPTAGLRISGTTIAAIGGASGGVGILVGAGSSGVLVRDTTLTGAGDSCVIDAGRGSRYVRVHISNCGRSTLPYGTHGLYLRGPGQSIRDSDVSDARSNCISIRYQNAVVEGNRVHDCPIGVAWFEYATAPGTAHIRRNRIWRTHTGIYTDESDGSPSQIFDISRNTIVGTAGGEGIVLDRPAGALVAGNVVSGPIATALSVSAVGRGGYSERGNVWAPGAAFGWNGRGYGFADYRRLSGEGAGSTAGAAGGAGAPPVRP